MPDFLPSDPDRILMDCAIGSVQAWEPNHVDDVSLSLSFYAHFAHKGETQSYTAASQYLTAADARNIAAVLVKAADHVDALIAKAPHRHGNGTP